MVKEMARNPIAIATFVVAVALSVATLNPAPFVIWIQATAASIAAQSVAMAAGVRNPAVLALIGAVAGAAAAGAGMSDLLKVGAKWGLNQGLAKLEGDKLALWLAPLNALASELAVNYAGEAIGNALSDAKVSDPGSRGANAQAGRSSSQPSEGAIVRAASEGDGSTTPVVRLSTTAPSKWQAFMQNLQKPSIQGHLFASGSFMYVGWHMFEAGLHILAAVGVTPWGAAAGTVALVLGMSMMIGGGLYAGWTVREAWNRKPRRNVRRRRRYWTAPRPRPSSSAVWTYA
jgi:hypothetical protein